MNWAVKVLKKQMNPFTKNPLIAEPGSFGLIVNYFHL
jgi:hypothetical protein